MTTRGRSLGIRYVVAGVLMCAAVGEVYAEAQLEEITVTARRRAESLQEVPLTVTALDAEIVQRAGVRNISDVSKLTPGFVIDKGFAPQDVRPNIRGLPSTRGRPPIGILLDGVDVSTESIATAGGGNLMNLSLVDVERIEVVKGPQSALYGRVAFGGAINYVSKEPGDKTDGYLDLDVGSYGKEEVRGAFTAVVNDRLSFRFNAEYEHFDGFYRNAATGAKIGGEESKGAAIAMRLKLGENSKILARIMYSDDSADPRPQFYYGNANGSDAPVALPASAVGQLVGPGAGTAPLPATFMQPVAGVLKPANGGVVNLSRDPATGKDYPGVTNKPLIGNVRGEFDVGIGTLATWTGYTHAKSSDVQDAAFWAWPLTQTALPPPGGAGELAPAGALGGNGVFQLNFATTTKQFSQEIRLSSPIEKPLRWGVGALYWWESVDQFTGSFTSFGLGPNVSTWLNAALQGGRAPNPQETGRNTNHESAYYSLGWDVTPKLTLETEGRYSKERYHYIFANSIGFVGNGVAAVAPFSVFGALCPGACITANASASFFSPSFAVNYKAADNVLTYLRAAKGVKPGGISQVANVTPDQGAFGPEVLWNYEGGIKTTWLNRRLQANVALFHMDYTNKQVSNLVPVPVTVNPQGNITLIQNIGQAKVDGAELELAWQATSELLLSAYYTYLDTRYTNYVVPSTSPLSIALIGNCTIAQLSTLRACLVSDIGHQLEQAPKNSLVAGATYRVPAIGDWNFLGSLSLQYRGQRFLEDSNQFILDSFVNADMQLGLENGKTSVYLYCSNCTNDKTIKSAQSSGDTAGGLVGGVKLLVEEFAPDKLQVGLRVAYRF